MKPSNLITARLLNLSLNSQTVPDQTTIDVIIHVAKYPNGRDLAWKFFQDKWSVFKSRYGEALFMNSKLIKGVTEFLSTEAELKEEERDCTGADAEEIHRDVVWWWESGIHCLGGQERRETFHMDENLKCYNIQGYGPNAKKWD
eukprot:g36303.t1